MLAHILHRSDPGLMPGIESLTNGDIPKKRKMLKEVIRPPYILSSISHIDFPRSCMVAGNHAMNLILSPTDHLQPMLLYPIHPPSPMFIVPRL